VRPLRSSRKNSKGRFCFVGLRYAPTMNNARQTSVVEVGISVLAAIAREVAGCALIINQGLERVLGLPRSPLHSSKLLRARSQGTIFQPNERDHDQVENGKRD
jgi:hypothetical protein